MLGHSLFRQYSQRSDLDVYATVKEKDRLEQWFVPEYIQKLQTGINIDEFDSVIRAIKTVKPDAVINCIAWVKPSQILENVLSAININARFPHRLALICQKSGSRFIQISSDVVFDGKKGKYTELDNVNISDLYGMTKFLGEVSYPNCVTIRTSIIGHELVGKTSLVEWFLSRNEKVNGYTRAIYSGFPTVELARIISDYVIPNDNLSGIYHVSSDPISKYELLCLIADRYEKKIEIKPSDEVVVDRSLDSTVFRSLTGYTPPSWPELINKMYLDYVQDKGRIYV